MPYAVLQIAPLVQRLRFWGNKSVVCPACSGLTNIWKPQSIAWVYLASSRARVLTLASAGPGPSSSHFVVFRLVLSRLLFLAQILQVKEKRLLFQTLNRYFWIRIYSFRTVVGFLVGALINLVISINSHYQSIWRRRLRYGMLIVWFPCNLSLRLERDFEKAEYFAWTSNGIS